MSTHRTTRLLALPVAALLAAGAALSGPTATAKPPARPDKVTGLAVQVTKPAAAYRLATAWTAGARATSYRVTATDTSGTVLDKGTVTAPAWVGSVNRAAGTSVKVSVTPYAGTRKGRPSTVTTVLPDLTAPTGSFTLSRNGSTATVTQTALADDLSPASAITRVVHWADGSADQAWTSGLTVDHVYAGTGLWRPSVTLTDAHGNSAEVPLGAVVVGDTTAPTGSFATGPASAWASWSKVGLTQLSIHDDFSAAGDVVRSVDWGDGTVTPWATGSPSEHVYAGPGTFTPAVALVDEAGNRAVVAATPVTVSRDTVGPVVKVRSPKLRRASVRTWRTVHGRATDAGTGVATVKVRAVQKRGVRWYAYRPATRTWVRAGATRAQAFRVARAARVVPTATGSWTTTLRHLKLGRLVVKAGARDHVGNASAPVLRAQLLRRY